MNPPAQDANSNEWKTEEADLTLADHVRRRLDLPWSKAKRAVSSGKILVNGRRELDPTMRPELGALLRHDPRGSIAPRKASAKGDIDVLYSDLDIVVVNKPVGLATIPFADQEPDNLFDRVIQWHRNDLRRRQKGSKQLGARKKGSPLVVHRLDKATSGILVFARHLTSQRRLKVQFADRTVDRQYLCVVHGRLDAEQSITSNLAADRGDGLRGSAEEGKWARTHVTPIAYAQNGQATLCRVKLETGRTHQIRIHLSEARHPLVGEEVYIRDFKRYGSTPLPSKRLMLHARTLNFVHPTHRKEMDFLVEPSKAFMDGMRQLGIRWTPARTA